MTVDNRGQPVTITHRPDNVLVIGQAAADLVVAAGGARTG